MGRTTRHPDSESPAPDAIPPRRFAVIEIGTTSVRMAAAEALPAGSQSSRPAADRDGDALAALGLRVLDTAQYPVSLGKDTFTEGLIRDDTTEACVKALRLISRLLAELDVCGPDSLRIVATSAVREAANRDAFVDRIYMATRHTVDVLDEAEVRRLTYLAVRPLLRACPPPGRATEDIVVEVGGGNTDVLLLRGDKVMHSFTVRAGSLRLREYVEDYHGPDIQLREIMEDQVARAIRQMRQSIATSRSHRLIALGGDSRIAAAVLRGQRPGASPVPVDVNALAQLTETVLDQSVDRTIQEYRLSYPEAETLGPALLLYVQAARAVGVDRILVGQATLRDGLLVDSLEDPRLVGGLDKQILRSVKELGARYGHDRQHAEATAGLAVRIFDALQSEHGLSSRHRLLLEAAALLHDIGLYVSSNSHHKHSMYLIMNSDVFGLGEREMRMIALIARYHRKAVPKPSHAQFAALHRDQRAVVSQLAAILRIADALCVVKSGRHRLPDVSLEGGRLVVRFLSARDLALERHRLSRKDDMFRQVYGLTVEIERAGEKRHGPQTRL